MHVNEDIPGDSLAATGTRFQRQIRTDRVRPSGSRARASTGGSQSGHRGHGRNLSTSSIASTASNVSTVSSMSTVSHENNGRRPQSTTLLDQRRGGLTIDTLRASPTHNYNYSHQSGSGNSTPTSYYAITPSSPFRSNLASPITLSHNNSWTDKHVARRLSVPSGTGVFQVGGPISQFPNQYSSINQSANSSILGSPTSSTFSTPRSEIPADDWRRRTWHPNTYSNYSYPRPATSGLSYSQTPNEPRPAFAPQALAAAGQPPKLPGIETFDQISNRPSTPPQRMQPSASAVVTPGRLSLYSTIDRRQPGHGHQRGVHSWDMSLHQNLTRLDITGDSSPRESGVWIHQQQPPDSTNSLQSSPQRSAIQTIHSIGSSQPIPVPPQLVLPSQPNLYVRSSFQTSPQDQASSSPPRLDPQQNIMTPPSSNQRPGWSVGVPHKLMQRSTQPAGSSSKLDSDYKPISNRDYQPQVVHANGYIESRPNAPGPVSLHQHRSLNIC